MDRNIIFENSGFCQVLKLLQRKGEGWIFTMNNVQEELKNISYTSIRSVTVSLCKRGDIIRVCRGVYYYPKNTKKELPFIDDVLVALEKQFGYKCCPIGEYVKYLIGFKRNCPPLVECYTSGKIKTINFANGIQAKMLPTAKQSMFRFSSRKLMIATVFLKGVNIDDLTCYELNILRNYIKDVDRSAIIKDIDLIPIPFREKMGIQF